MNHKISKYRALWMRLRKQLTEDASATEEYVAHRHSLSMVLAHMAEMEAEEFLEEGRDGK